MDRCAAVLLLFPETFSNDLPDPEYNKAARQHVQKVENLSKDGLLAKFAPQLLPQIDPAINSISFLALLLESLSDRSKKNIDAILPHLVRFLMTFDARQIRYALTQMSNLLTAFAEFERAPMINDAPLVVDLLATALLRIDPTGSVLTTHHLTLVRLAYTTNSIEPALPVLEKTVVFFPGSKPTLAPRLLCDMAAHPTTYITPETGFGANVTPSTVLKYDALRALCFIQRRSWQQAFDSLQHVITYPTAPGVCSNIMADCFQKWQLVGLLLNGKAPSLPFSVATSNIYQTTGKAYIAIAQAFESNTAEALIKEYGRYTQDEWVADGNLGLVKAVLSHYQRWKIADLRHIYTKISLEQIRTLTQSAETGASLGSEQQILNLVQDMIATGMLKGEVVPAANGKPAHLVFHSLTEELSSATFAASMSETTHRIAALAPLVDALCERLETSREYVRHMTRDSNKFNTKDRYGAAGGGGSGGHPFEEQVDDEDLMIGLSTAY
ncbi:COP9 signalosome complex subunit 3 [Podospora conica]|nr:COP9 signalosome complex subunit 3 [Schizothecium conicum]